MHSIRAAFVVLLFAVAVPAFGQACAGFTDVSAGHPFCQNVEWLKNRGVTTGCTSATLFCPNDPVSRLQMALFMNRLANALAPAVVRVESSGGATDLSTQPVLCQTADQAIDDFPRTFMVWAVLTALGATVENLAIDVVRSTNGGPFVAINQQSTIFPLRNQVSNNAFLLSSPQNAAVELAVDSTYRFGLRVARTTGLGNLLNFQCHLILEIRNRQGTATPF
jgi:hypothetical protein